MKASFLGYRPKDNAVQFTETVFTQEARQDLDDPKNFYQGGPFAAVPLGNSGVATMNIVDDTKKT